MDAFFLLIQAYTVYGAEVLTRSHDALYRCQFEQKTKQDNKFNWYAQTGLLVVAA